MSGNPFRRPAPPLPISTNVENDVKVAPESAPPGAYTYNVRLARCHILTLHQAGRRSSKPVKRVRIQTPPPLSPDTPAEEYPVWPTAEQFQSNSSAPPLAASNERFVLPFPAMDRGSEEDQHQDAEVLENTRRNSGGDAAGFGLGSGGVPNPFAKTSERSDQKVEQKNVSQELDWSAAQKGAAEKAKAAETKQKAGLDVDSFTRLLLTGKAASGSADARSMVTTTSTPQPMSNTAGREATPRAAPPARSNPAQYTQTQDDDRDLSDLESASSDESDDEYTTPLSRKIEQPEIEKESIPAPPSQPAPQAPRGPQTVGFSDWDSFDIALPTSTPKVVPPTFASKPAPPPSRRNRAHSGDSPSESPQPEPSKLLAPRPPRPRKTSSHLDPMDLPSPDAIPAQPSMPAPPRPRAHSNLSIKSSNSSTMDTPTETPPSPTAPTPAHLAATSRVRDRGDSTASTASYTPSLTTTAKPVPPPARRAAPKPPGTLTTSISQPYSNETDQGRRLSPAGLPVDPGRRPSPAGLSSLNSARSSPNAARTATMPPPPPPKRRGSSKGSLDISDSRRGSATRSSQDGARPALAAVYGEDEPRVKNDMFADLDALQKEVDALRKSFG